MIPLRERFRHFFQNLKRTTGSKVRPPRRIVAVTLSDDMFLKENTIEQNDTTETFSDM